MLDPEIKRRLDFRLASGEITAEEYDRLVDKLSQSITVDTETHARSENLLDIAVLNLRKGRGTAVLIAAGLFLLAFLLALVRQLGFFSSNYPSVDEGMVFIPGGTFQMGCSLGDSECDDDEKPTHNETVSSFYADITEVTQVQFRKEMGTNPSQFSSCANCPAERVTLDEARSYCSKVGKRLPTEAEWEYAARGGTARARYGNLDTIAWYDRNSGNTTHPVGQKDSNAYGLHDMLGNVQEWTETEYDSSYRVGCSWLRLVLKRTETVYDWSPRVLRGGSWLFDPGDARASSRLGFGPADRFNFDGFRCFRDGG